MAEQTLEKLSQTLKQTAGEIDDFMQLSEIKSGQDLAKDYIKKKLA